MKRLFFLILLGLCQPVAWAAVYKCENAEGKLEYQGMPCDKGSSMNIRPGTAAPAATTKASDPVAPQAPTPGTGRQVGERKCVGKELRINFTNMPVMTTLQVLADFSGHRLEADPAITGGGAFQYDCLPWDTVLQDVAARYKLSAKVAGGVISVTKR